MCRNHTHLHRGGLAHPAAGSRLPSDSVGQSRFWLPSVCSRADPLHFVDVSGRTASDLPQRLIQTCGSGLIRVMRTRAPGGLSSLVGIFPCASRASSREAAGRSAAQARRTDRDGCAVSRLSLVLFWCRPLPVSLSRSALGLPFPTRCPLPLHSSPTLGHTSAMSHSYEFYAGMTCDGCKNASQSHTPTDTGMAGGKSLLDSQHPRVKLWHPR